MTQIVSIEDRLAEVEFVRKAAAAFAGNSVMTSYGDLAPGSLLAIRWGLHNRAIKVLRLCEAHTPVIYGDAVPASGSEVPAHG